MMIQADESTPDIAPLFVYRIVWLSMEGSCRSKYRVIGNFYLQTITVLHEGGAASGFDSMPLKK